MPGEERPSLVSVRPYDDNHEDMVKKVESILVQEGDGEDGRKKPKTQRKAT